MNKVFICEDDSAIADVLKVGLEQEDLNVQVETNSVFAFGKLLDFKPEIVIVDLQMPVVSGDMLIQTIRGNRTLKNCFILCITANDRGREIALDAGANMIIHKPFQLQQLIDVVRSVLDAKGENRVK
ncbi:response regulator [Sphingobacterium oryzagri]|uniref:Response regulator n=1 Tax=Sphingobacterium oryzagri TaxID=3025669 RepID=A0ABY7WBT3_9SPHI|nr:response regulator [Sphingobacterium sp. KACC 22765]WDF67098.1 response regulator [Sphingobacterium sp. KACC 22765]